MSKESERRIALCYVCEKEHHPVEHGTLEYDPVLGRWNSAHPDQRLQRMAESYMETYLLRKNAMRNAVSNPQ